MTHVETFKNSVVRIRDLLRSQGITGMDSMRHICLYLMSRYMTEKRSRALGIPDEFSWNALMTLMQKGDTVSATDVRQDKDEYALNHFYNTNTETECVVRHIDSLFGTEKFPFDVKCPIRHKETMKILSTVELDEVDVHMDVLGWVYEQHLKTGSSAARDLGQFFTDRSICTYMTELCRPAFKYPGVPESMCDPSMGTGGFQAAYMKYYKRYQGTPNQVDWKIQHTEIHGCDTDQKVAGLARLNLFIESGGALFTHLKHRDSLYDDLLQTGYDVILANMPFGLKGLKHADCCERVRALKINGTKSEPLFLQLMMVSLNVGGRCAVVVPDGMLVNTSVCHNGTRKYLLDHFELKRVIKMTGKFFMNTGIQPSILFFEHTGKPTEAVEFWDVVADVNGSVEETMVLSVPRAAIDEACSLDMRRYQETKEVANPAGFPMVKLGEIAELCRNNTTIVDDVNGDYTKYFGPKHVGKCSNYQFDGEYILTPNRQSIGLLGYVNEKFTATHTFVIKVNSEHSSKYVYYYLLLNDKLSEKSKGIIPYIKNEDILTLQVILPPLAIQQEIVSTLDRIYQPGTTELAETLKLTSQAIDLVLAQPSGATLEPIVEAQRLIRKSAQMVADVKAQMVADVKAQMVAIVKSVGCRGFPMVKLGNLFEVKGGKAISKVNLTGTQYPYYGCNGINGYIDEFLYDGEYIVCAQDGSIGSVYLLNEKFYPSNHTHILKTRDEMKITNVYGAYFLKMNVDWKSITTSIIPKVTQGNLLEIELVVPPLAFQHAVVARLDALQSQLTALESLQRQSEDNARFILESYLHTEEPHASSASEDDEKEEPCVTSIVRSTPIRRPRSVSPARAAENVSAAVAEDAASAVAPPNYESMSLAALKDLCKARGLRGLSGKKKEELVVILRDLS